MYGIFISVGAEIGEGCTIFQHVTIESNTLGDSAKIGAPKIGNNVYIGAGAKLLEMLELVIMLELGLIALL
ncbi:MAG: hypothetical protein R3Y09_08995 [Clostridia bacterium]